MRFAPYPRSECEARPDVAVGLGGDLGAGIRGVEHLGSSVLWWLGAISVGCLASARIEPRAVARTTFALSKAVKARQVGPSARP